MMLSNLERFRGDPRMPNLFIIGAQKAATTSFAETLSKHPEIYISPLKEPHFLVQVPGPDPSFNKLKMPFGNTFSSVQPRGNGRIETIESYLELFSNGINAKIRAEASPTNLVSPNAVDAIKCVAPEAKLIAILRNPYDRAFSGYNYFYSNGREPCTTFESAIQHELNGERNEWIYGLRYIYMGLYHRHIMRYIKKFDRKQIHIIIFDDLIHNPSSSIRKVLEFLGCDKTYQLSLVQSNRTITHKINVLKKVKTLLMSPKLRRYLPLNPSPNQHALLESMRSSLIKIIDIFGVQTPRITNTERSLLSNIFEPEIEKLETLLQRDLSMWSYHRRLK